MITNILEYLESTVQAHPEKIAFSDGFDSISFKDLHKLSKIGGSYLCNHGVERAPVMIIMDKHPNEIVAFLSVIYAGGYYVPIDSEMPIRRIETIAQTLSCQLIICDSKNLKLAQTIGVKNIITFEELVAGDVREEALGDVRRNQIDTDPIYIVFTSGSTGIPKGVVACHRSVIDYTEALSEALKFDSNNVFGNQTPLYFDAPLKEIMPTLKFGATTYFIPKKLFMFPIKLVEYLNEHKINTICWVVSALTMISAFGVFDKMKPGYLTTVAFGSEVFPLKQFNIWIQSLPQAEFYNLYGPTEATGMSCYWHCDRQIEDGEAIPIGKPFKNTRILLINDKGHPAVCDEPGEIYICGTCVTLGYYQNKDKTSEAFVQNPLHSNYPDIVYKTGDLAKYNKSGELVFISRKDFQIKHMGHRIELGEIESAADSFDGVARACCIYNNEKKKIHMFYMGSIGEKDLSTQLKDYLPRYMIPATLTKLDSLPLTANGKLNRQELNKIASTL